MILRISAFGWAGPVGDLPHRGVEANFRRRVGFVSRYFGRMLDFGFWMLAGYGWRFWFGRGGRWNGLGRGARADAWAEVGGGRSGLLQLAESGVGFVVAALETGFVTGHQRQAAGLIGQRADG